MSTQSSTAPISERLFQFVAARMEALKEVESGARPDNSEDAVKVCLSGTRFEHFLTGDDSAIVPITFEVWPSLSCDARCPTCTYIRNDARAEADRSETRMLFDVDLFGRVVEDLAANRVSSVILTGGGEPLLHPAIDGFAAHIRRCGLSWGMFTHGLHLNRSLFARLAAHQPTFIRISLNSWDNASHWKEYHIREDAFDVLETNIRQIGKLAESTRLSLGYAVDGRTDDRQIKAIATAIIRLFEASGGALAGIAFRPKVIYYSGGESVIRQPRSEGLAKLPSLLREKLVPLIRASCGGHFRVDIKDRMFGRLAEALPIQPILCTNWAGQMDHRASLYIMSELNGTPWPGASFGRLDGCNFKHIWMSPEHERMRAEFARDSNRVPRHHKLSHVDELLREIRKTFGVMSRADARAYSQRISAATPINRHHMNFL